jgi:hypothetical protein
VAQNVSRPNDPALVLNRAEAQYARAYIGYLLGRRTKPHGTNEGLSNADGKELERQILENQIEKLIGVDPPA